jgi:hypothetical protein
MIDYYVPSNFTQSDYRIIGRVDRCWKNTQSSFLLSKLYEKKFVEFVQFAFLNLLLQRRSCFCLFCRTDSMPYWKCGVTHIIHYSRIFSF